MQDFFFHNLVKMVFGLQYKWKMRENDCEWGVPQKRQIVRNSSSWFSPRNLQDLDTSACRWRGDRVSSLRNVECREGLQLVEWFHRGGFKHLVCLRLLAEMITLSLYLGQSRGFKCFCSLPIIEEIIQFEEHVFFHSVDTTTRWQNLNKKIGRKIFRRPRYMFFRWIEDHQVRMIQTDHPQHLRLWSFFSTDFTCDRSGRLCN